MAENSVWQFATAGTIKYGRGCREQLEQVVLQRGLRPLVVTDSNLMQVGLIQELLALLEASSLQHCVFSGSVAEPAIAIAEEACEVGRAHRADCVIGIGGGSNLDVAKVAATVLKHGGVPSDYFGFDAVPGPVLPMFAIPTTAGTGSEVSHSAVLTDPEKQIKVSTLSQWLRPAVAIVDPALTDSCPPSVTGPSGIDALVHAIEAFTNRDFSQMVDVDPQARAYEGSYPLTRLLASEAIELVGKHLVTACREPDNQASRDAMAQAAMLAGMAFSNSGVGIVHALEYPVGALTHCGHGEGNGLILPHVMKYNRSHRVQAFGRIAALLGVDVTGMSPAEAADRAIVEVETLQERVGIRKRLRDLGLREDQISQVAEKAFAIRRLMDLNPRTPTQQDLESILRSAF